MYACTLSCDDEEVAACEDACLEQSQSCEHAQACFGTNTAEGQPWSTGPYGTEYRDVAGPFTVPTLRGDFDFQSSWTGHDSHVFLITQTGVDYSQQLWASEVIYWLQKSPLNVHYFFMAYADKNGVDDAASHMAAMKSRVDEAVTKIGLIAGKPSECNWRRRIHYVPVSAWSLGDWVGPMLQQTPRLVFAIDRFQQLRPIGLLSLVNGPPLLYHVRFEPEYYNFEWEREQNLVKDDVTVVTLFNGEAVNGSTIDVEFPSAEEMATYDTLEMDLSQFCEGHDDQNCFEWDYKAFLNVREHPLVVDNPHAETACQPKINAVEAQQEVLGLCPDGQTTCTADIDCADSEPCEGYSAAVEEVIGVDADTLECQCAVPGDLPRSSSYTCNEEGTGYGNCSCEDQFEIGRWITTYHREGRWIADLSAFLPYLSNGGQTRFRYKGSYPYLTTLHMRLYNQGKADRATSVQRLFTGSNFGPNYSDKYEPIVVDIPADATRVEIVAYITGHGFGNDAANCAEFCNHTHHFGVNGSEHMHEHHWIDNYYGCAEQVSEGTVPNQFGTWTIGRGGWCPGQDVTPFVADVTADVVPGDPATIDYHGYLNGVPWMEGQATFGGSIWMNSYLVVYK
jgi:hypothetical protein